MHRYFGTAFMYSGMRKMVYTWDSKYRDVDYKDHKKIISERPILYVDRYMHFVFGGLLGMVNFPIYLFNDIRNIEMYARNIKKPSYLLKQGDEQGFLDVMFDLHV